jgi:hypothetical protein
MLLSFLFTILIDGYEMDRVHERSVGEFVTLQSPKFCYKAIIAHIL